MSDEQIKRRSPDPEFAKTGLGLIVLSWLIVSAVEVAAHPAGFLMPVLRTALVIALAAAVLKGNRAASGVLLVWSILGMFLGGTWLTLVIVASGAFLFLFSGGSKAFRPPPPSIEPDTESAQSDSSSKPPTPD
jgi:hypothetical protein